MKLFYAVRRVVDEAGRSLPKGAAVQGLLFDQARYDRADTIGQDIPIYVEAPGGIIMNATQLDAMDPMAMRLSAPLSTDELRMIVDELEARQEDGRTAAIALPADSMLWAVALTGLPPTELQCLEGNEGA